MECYYSSPDTPEHVRVWISRRNRHSHRVDRFSGYLVDGVPRSLLEKMCECINSDFQPKTPVLKLDSEKRLGFCGRCGKLPWHYLMICSHCSEYFIKDFKSPQFCVYVPTCWHCTEEKPIHIECRHVGKFSDTKLKPQLTRIEPLPGYDFGEDLTFTLD